MDPASIAIGAAAGTAAAAYLNGKYHIYKDIRGLYHFWNGERLAQKAIAAKRECLFYPLEATCQKYPTTRAIWSREGSYNYADMYERVKQYANYMLSLGIKPGDAVGLYSPNTPEFLFVVFATWAIGCFPALINYNLADESLVHCVTVAQAKILFVEGEDALVERINNSSEKFKELGIKPIVLDRDLKQQIANFPDTRPGNEMRDHAQGNFPVALIYTSGTTGLPKAFPYSTHRLYSDAPRFKAGVRLAPAEDIWYVCMPMYHGTGLITGLQSMLNGAGIAIGRKFSVSSFWKDVHDSEATCFSYVGETARYLLAAPPSPLDKDHKLRVMYGNGLRPDVWEKFQARFNVPSVYEFFTSTEGMFGVLVWSQSGFGAKTVGHQGLIVRTLMHGTFVPVALDADTNDMYRDPQTGFARRVPYEQGGEIIVKIPGREAWPGYYNNKAGTNKKIATDVFVKGDIYYRPGDALRRDADGLWYFMDRLGDTFRWKGENVSTAEVQDVMGKFPRLSEANVYGVEVPGSEGRAGCAAVILEDNKPSAGFDWRGLTQFLRARLPRYAVPVFIRVVDADAQAMGTHNNKQNKVLLRAEGADPQQLGTKVPHGQKDKMYWLPPNADAYKPFEHEDWEQIAAKKAKL